MTAKRGWFRLPCWNALSPEQQSRLIDVGNLPFGWEPDGDGCENGATVAIEQQGDEAPGPRFYCRGCAREALTAVEPGLRDRGREVRPEPAGPDRSPETRPGSRVLDSTDPKV
jgi:hypothetical protein